MTSLERKTLIVMSVAIGVAFIVLVWVALVWERTG